MAEKHRKQQEFKKETCDSRQVDCFVSTESNHLVVMIQVIYQGRYYSAYVDIPSKKQGKEYIRQQVSGLAETAIRKIKELFISSK